MPFDTFNSFFQERFIQEAVRLYQLKLVVYDPQPEFPAVLHGDVAGVIEAIARRRNSLQGHNKAHKYYRLR